MTKGFELAQNLKFLRGMLIKRVFFFFFLCLSFSGCGEGRERQEMKRVGEDEEKNGGSGRLFIALTCTLSKGHKTT